MKTQRALGLGAQQAFSPSLAQQRGKDHLLKQIKRHLTLHMVDLCGFSRIHGPTLFALEDLVASDQVVQVVQLYTHPSTDLVNLFSAKALFPIPKLGISFS